MASHGDVPSLYMAGCLSSGRCCSGMRSGWVKYSLGKGIAGGNTIMSSSPSRTRGWRVIMAPQCGFCSRMMTDSGMGRRCRGRVEVGGMEMREMMGWLW